MNWYNICEKCVFNIIKSRRNLLQKSWYHTKLKNALPLITCRRKEFNFYNGQITSNLDEHKLASKGWHHMKSKGDYFIFHKYIDEQVHSLNSTFSHLGLSENLVTNLSEYGVAHPTFIQEKAIPVLLSNQNTLITAETGCGKTLAYLLPVIQQIISYKSSLNTSHDTVFNAPMCLVLTPSRELAYQIEDVARTLVKDLQISTHCIVGGGTKRKMLNPSFTEIDLLVATPGALNKLISAGIYKMSNVQHVILDEADTLLDESFSQEISYFLRKFRFESSIKQQQLTLVSATMPVSLPDAITDIVIPESLNRITTNHIHKVLPHVPQRFLRIGRSMKPSQLLQIVKKHATTITSCDKKALSVMIFSNKSATCDWISLFLSENGVKCVNLNGDMPLELRKQKFVDFQRGKVNVLSSTDVGSRGLDTIQVNHIINYDFPKYIADYIHRCGRTGRINSPANCHITNFIADRHEITLAQKIELTKRTEQCLPNVNGNISGIVKCKAT